MYSFFKEESFGLRHQLTFIGQEMKIYLPKNYLEPDSIFANKLGNAINTIGLFWFSVNNKFYELSLPLKIEFEYQSEETFKGKLSPELSSMEYDVFVLKTGDAFCRDLNHKQDISDLETMFLRIIDQGKLPQTVDYQESIAIVLNLFSSSGIGSKLGVSSALVEILLSELYRNKHNPNEPFRKLLNSSSSASLFDFKMIRMTKLPQLNSIFNSIVGEDTYNQLANSIVRQREGAKDRVTPMEKLLKY